MSYILEALKKAEAERRSGTIPSIHVPPALSAAQAQPAWRNPLPVLIAVVALTILAVVAWRWSAPRSEPVVLASAPVTAPPDVVPPAAAPVPATPPQEVLETEPVAEQPPPARHVSKKEAPANKAKARKNAPAQDEPKPAAAADTGVASIDDLPPQIRRELPSLSVDGYIYSGNKAARSVLINKRLLREGDEVAPGVRLEAMTPTGLVLSYKGYRYRRSYQ